MPPATTQSADDLQRRFEAMLDRSRDTGAGGREILELAYHTLAGGRALSRWPDVGLEDLWAHALKEGRTLFDDAATRWGRTGPRQTKDMIGQTTIGPWQITVTNVQADYGLPYGISPEWRTNDVFDFCQEHPVVQAGMICDYVQRSYATLGRRGPLAIQRYFWLKAFVKREIGQGAWDKSVLPVAPDGDWTKLTPALKVDTGFYAKQVLLGTTYNPRGLLYWLWVTGDADAIRATLDAWATQREATWDEAAQKAVLGEPTDRYTISVDDLKYVPDEPCKAALAGMLK